MFALLVFGITQSDNGLNSYIMKLHRLWRKGKMDEFSLKTLDKIITIINVIWTYTSTIFILEIAQKPKPVQFIAKR